MANNYSQATINPYIPVEHVTDTELGLLNLAGITYDKYPEGCYYFYAGDNLNSSICTDWLEEDEADFSITPDPRNNSYFNQDGSLCDDIEVAEIFQNILHRLPQNVEYIEIHGADTCDKLRMDNFGGFAFYITRSEIDFFSTWDWLQSKKMECLK